ITETRPDTPRDTEAAKAVQEYVNKPFESMDALLNTTSPLYRDRFQKKLFDRLAELAADRSEQGEDDAAEGVVEPT
ncbi:hypothetical protein HK104_006739, partial [Borealophlyctis nickersoniae]